jgi:hypothetical protein
MAKKPNKFEGKFIIAFDTLADGWQCATDENGKPDPELFDCPADAMFEMFGDAVCMLRNRTAADRKEVGVSEAKFKEMQKVFDTGDTTLMTAFLDQNEECNYNSEFIVPADEFILGRKAIFGSEGLKIIGKKLK